MAPRTPGPIIRSGFPRAGSLVGDQKRDEFIAGLQALGGLVLLLLPKLTDTTTSTDASRNAATCTWDATVASRMSAQGSGVILDFDGTDDEGDIPDATRYSFGNGVVDRPFSVGGLWRPDDQDANETLICKQNSATAEEWTLRLYSDGSVFFVLTDESATAEIYENGGGATGTSLALLGGTYDGSGSREGLHTWKNGAVQATNRGSSGTYVAMENTAALVHIGARYTTKSLFFDGGMGFCFIYERTLDVEDWWTIKTLTNAYFDLTL